MRVYLEHVYCSGLNTKLMVQPGNWFKRLVSRDARYTKSIYALLSRSTVWSLLCYCVRDRDHCCALCDVARDLLLTWYIVHQPKLATLGDM